VARSGYRNLSTTPEALDALNQLTVIIGERVGRRVSQSEAIRIAARVVVGNRSLIAEAVNDLADADAT